MGYVSNIEMARTPNGVLAAQLLAIASGVRDREHAEAKHYLTQLADRLARDAALPAILVDAPAAAIETRSGGLAPWKAKRVEAYIDRRLAYNVQGEELARVADLSISHFSRAFKITFGVPPHAHILRRRIARAQEMMLNSSKSLCQIALDCGLSDQAHLSRVFRRIVGDTPGSWRRAHWRKIALAG